MTAMVLLVALWEIAIVAFLIGCISSLLKYVDTRSVEKRLIERKLCLKCKHHKNDHGQLGCGWIVSQGIIVYQKHNCRCQAYATKVSDKCLKCNMNKTHYADLGMTTCGCLDGLDEVKDAVEKPVRQVFSSGQASWVHKPQGLVYTLPFAEKIKT
jgi:hypothetical protein